MLIALHENSRGHQTLQDPSSGAIFMPTHPVGFETLGFNLWEPWTILKIVYHILQPVLDLLTD